MMILNSKSVEKLFEMILDAYQPKKDILENKEEQIEPLELVGFLFVILCIFLIGFCLWKLL